MEPVDATFPKEPSASLAAKRLPTLVLHLSLGQLTKSNNSTNRSERNHYQVENTLSTVNWSSRCRQSTSRSAVRSSVWKARITSWWSHSSESPSAWADSLGWTSRRRPAHCGFLGTCSLGASTRSSISEIIASGSRRSNRRPSMTISFRGTICQMFLMTSEEAKSVIPVAICLASPLANVKLSWF